MPPHIFRIFSDDPTRLEKQIGCMTGFFHIFEQQQRAPRRPVLASNGSSDSSVTNSFTSSTLKGSKKKIKDQRKGGVRSSAADRPSSKESPKSSNNTFTSGSCRHSCNVAGQPNSSQAVPRFTWYAEDHPDFVAEHGEVSRNSPSILDSSRSTVTIRESPRKSFNIPDPDNFSQRSSLTKPSNGSSCELSRGYVEPYLDESRISLDSREISGRSFDPKRKNLRIDTSEDPLTDLKESLRTLAKLQQATQDFVSSLEVPKLDSDDKVEYLENSSWHAYDDRQPERCSSFDYTEAIRISQKMKETPPRHSLDGRVIPKSVLRLREAMRSHLGEFDCPLAENLSSPAAREQATRSAAISSSKPSFRREPARGFRPVSNVIARLMGLEDLPTASNMTKPAHAMQVKTPFKEAIVTFDNLPKPVDAANAKKRSNEARLLKELLHCKSPADSFRDEPQARERRCTVENLPAWQREEERTFQRPSEQFKLQNELKATTERTLSKDQGKIDELPRQMINSSVTNYLEVSTGKSTNAPKHAFEVMPSISKKQKKRSFRRTTEYHHKGHFEHQTIEGTQLEQRIMSFQEEVQRRLRHLGTSQNSLMERKTLKEILHLETLLKPPQVVHAVDKLKDGRESMWSRFDEHSIKRRQVAAISDKGPAVVEELAVIPDHAHTRPLPLQRDQTNSSASCDNVFDQTVVIMKSSGETSNRSPVKIYSPPSRPRLTHAGEVDNRRKNKCQPEKQQRIIPSESRRRREITAFEIQSLRPTTTERSCKSKTAGDIGRKQPAASSSLHPATMRCASPPPRERSPRKQPSKAFADVDGDVKRIKLQLGTAQYAGNNGASNQPSSLREKCLGTVQRSISKMPAFGATSTRGRKVASGECSLYQKLEIFSENERGRRGQELSALGAKANVEDCTSGPAVRNSGRVSGVDTSAREMHQPDGRTNSSDKARGQKVESCIESCQADKDRQSKDIGEAEMSRKLCVTETDHGWVTQRTAKSPCIQELSSLMNKAQLTDLLKIIVPETHSVQLQAVCCEASAKEMELRSPISVLDRHDEHQKFLISVNTERSSRGKVSRYRCPKMGYPVGDGSYEFEYVHRVLLAAGLLAGDAVAILQAWVCSGCAIPPGVFFELERTWNASVSFSVAQRQLIFACVDEIVAGKLISAATYPAMNSRMPNGDELLRAVWFALRRLYPPKKFSKRCFGTESDWICTLLKADLEERTDSRAPISELVVHLEQLIFTDLVQEL